MYARHRGTGRRRAPAGTHALRSALLLVPVCLTACMPASLAFRGAPAEELRTLELELAPMDLPVPGHHDGHGGLEPPPLHTAIPQDGWLHGFDLEIVDRAGRPAPREVLHHVKLMSPRYRELFSPLMLRVAAAGSETGPVLLPRRVGYFLSTGDSLLVTAMLHNPTGAPLHGIRVRIRLHYTPRGPWKAPMNVVPFSTHVTEPLAETSYDLPPGRSERSIEVQPAVSGTVLGLGGHLHRYGIGLRLEDVASGRVLWKTEPERAPDGSILEIPYDVLVWSGGIDLHHDRLYRVTATYDNPTGDTIHGGGMGTLGGIIVPDGPWPKVDRSSEVYRWDLEREISHTAVEEGGAGDQDLVDQHLKRHPGTDRRPGAP